MLLLLLTGLVGTTHACTHAQYEEHVNVLVWDEGLELPVSVAPLAWLPQKNAIVTAPYVASASLTRATTGAAGIEFRRSGSSRHAIQLPDNHD